MGGELLPGVFSVVEGYTLRKSSGFCYENDIVRSDLPMNHWTPGMRFETLPMA